MTRPALAPRVEWPGVIRAYRDRMPLVKDGWDVVTLREGGTPLLPAPHLSALTGCEVHLKIEGANPTGSFKDRGMTVAMTEAAAGGAKAVICASTGNTSASAAAYSARAGMTCAVLVPQGKIALGKLAQATAHGARILQLDGNFDACLELARKAAEEYPIALVNSVNPARIEGQKTASFEVCDQLGRAPDLHVLPVGNAGNITAYWRGYVEYHRDGVVEATPEMHGLQAAGAAPLVDGAPVRHPETLATAIRIGSPASWDRRDRRARRVRRAHHEGRRRRDPRRVPPARGPRGGVRRAGLGGLASRACWRARRRGSSRAGRLVVCTVTGHGLKDPGTALADVPEPVVVPERVDAVADALGLG